MILLLRNLSLMFSCLDHLFDPLLCTHVILLSCRCCNMEEALEFEIKVQKEV